MNRDLYSKLYANNIFTGDFATFKQKYNGLEGAKSLYSKLYANEIYTKSFDEFLLQYPEVDGAPIQMMKQASDRRSQILDLKPSYNSDNVKRPTTPLKLTADINPIIQADMIKFGVYDNSPDELKSVLQEDIARKSYEKIELIPDLPEEERDNLFNEYRRIIENYYDTEIARQPTISNISERGEKQVSDEVGLKNISILKLQKLNQLNNLESLATAHSVLQTMAESKKDFDYDSADLDSIRKNALEVGIAIEYPTQRKIREIQKFRAGIISNPDLAEEAKFATREVRMGLTMNPSEYQKNLYYGLKEKEKWISQKLEYNERAQKHHAKEYEEYLRQEIEPRVKEIDKLTNEEKQLNAELIKKFHKFIQIAKEQHDEQMLEFHQEEIKLKHYSSKLQELKPEVESYAKYHEFSENAEKTMNIQTDVVTPVVVKKLGYGILDWATSIVNHANNLMYATPKNDDLKLIQALRHKSTDLVRKQMFNIPEAKDQEFAKLYYKKNKEGDITGIGFNFDFTSLPYIMTKTLLESYLMGVGGAIFGKAAGIIFKLNQMKLYSSMASRLTAMGVEKSAQFVGMYPAAYILFGQEIFENELAKTQDPDLARKLTHLRIAVEVASELLNPIEIKLYRNHAGLLADISKEQAEKISLKLFNSTKYSNLIKTLTLSKVAGKEFLTMSGMEYLEEAMANLGNFTIDQFQSSKYKKENELSLQNEFLTAVNTIAGMGALGGIHAYRSIKNAKTTSQYIIGKLGDSFHQKNQELLKSGKIDQTVFNEREKVVANAEIAYQSIKPIHDKFENIIKSANTDKLPLDHKEIIDNELSEYSNNMSYLLFQNNQKINELSEELLKESHKYDNPATSKKEASKIESEIDKLILEMEKLHKTNETIEKTATAYLEKIAKFSVLAGLPEIKKKQREQEVTSQIPNPIVVATSTEEELKEQATSVQNIQSNEEEQEEPSKEIISIVQQAAANIQERKEQISKDQRDARLYHLAKEIASGNTQLSEDDFQFVVDNQQDVDNLVKQMEADAQKNKVSESMKENEISEPIKENDVTDDYTTDMQSGDSKKDQKTTLKEERVEVSRISISENEADINKENEETTENNIQKNKLIDIRELISDNIETVGLKITNAFSSFATRMREFTTDIKGDLGISVIRPISDELNPQYIKLLSRKLYTSGTKIKFVVKHNDDYITESRLQFLKNAENPFNSDYLNKKDYTKDEYFIPIEIQDEEGNIIGYVHSLDYIRPDKVVTTTDKESNVRDNLVRNYNNLKILRKKIISLSKKNKEVKTVIVDKTDGHLSIRADKKYVPIREAFNNKETIDSLTLSNNQEWAEGISKGRPIVVVQTVKGELTAIGLKREQITKELAISVKAVVRAYLRRDKKVMDIIYDKLNIDISSPEGLQKYLNMIVYTNTDRRAMFGTSTIDARLRANIPFVSFDLGNETIYFSTQRIIRDDTPIDPYKLSPPNDSLDKQLNEIGVFRIKLNPGTPMAPDKEEELLSRFEKTLQSLYLNFNDKAINDRTGEFTLPLFDNSHKLIESPKFDNSGKSYLDFIIKHLYSNVLEHRIEYTQDGKEKIEYTYFEQPNVYFDANLDKYNQKKKAPEFQHTLRGFKVKEDSTATELVQVVKFKTGKNKGEIKHVLVNTSLLAENYEKTDKLLTFEEFKEQQIEIAITEKTSVKKSVPVKTTTPTEDDLFGDLDNIPGAESSKSPEEKRYITDQESEDINNKCNE